MAKTERSRAYAFQRNYKYESHDADGQFLGLTKEQWKQQICDEWTSDRLKANHVVFVFHDKDLDDHGSQKDLHVHGCVHFTDAVTQSEAVKRTGCSSDMNCKAINNKSQAYRYLLHITEQAIDDGKHIYDEDCLQMSVADGKKFNYHKMIKLSPDKEEAKDDASLLRNTIKAIATGKYDDYIFTNNGVRRELLLDERIGEMICKKSSSDREIQHAIETRKEIVAMQQKANR